MTAANDMEADLAQGEFTDEMQAAFQRAMEYSELCCPLCWVREGQKSELMVLPQSESTESYQCDVCGFDEELEKPD